MLTGILKDGEAVSSGNVSVELFKINFSLETIKEWVKTRQEGRAGSGTAET